MYRRSFFNCLEAASCISGRNIPCPTRAACIVGMPNRSRGSTRQRREVQRLSEYPVGRGNHYPMAWIQVALICGGMLCVITPL